MARTSSSPLISGMIQSVSTMPMEASSLASASKPSEASTMFV
jgi:hypothetical protein